MHAYQITTKAGNRTLILLQRHVGRSSRVGARILITLHRSLGTWLEHLASCETSWFSNSNVQTLVCLHHLF